MPDSDSDVLSFGLACGLVKLPKESMAIIHDLFMNEGSST